MTRSRCQCGKVKSKYSITCEGCWAKKSEGLKRFARVIVTRGKCPQCGAGLRRNLALAGWWQCEQYGAEGFRKDPSRPSCSWQAFTE